MAQDIELYHQQLAPEDKDVCQALHTIINKHLPEATSKVWHRHPVWFLNENPIVGYSKQKNGIRLMFWSGADFEEDTLNVRGQKFKDASIFYNRVDQIDPSALQRCLENRKLFSGIIKTL